MRVATPDETNFAWKLLRPGPSSVCGAADVAAVGAGMGWGPGGERLG
jgi:hypothetical protein